MHAARPACWPVSQSSIGPVHEDANDGFVFEHPFVMHSCETLRAVLTGLLQNGFGSTRMIFEKVGEVVDLNTRKRQCKKQLDLIKEMGTFPYKATQTLSSLLCLASSLEVIFLSACDSSIGASRGVLRVVDLP